MSKDFPFNVRVYGICFNEANELLICDELIKGMQITKLPGGGLEYGEGPAECIVREFKEETGSDIEVLRHFYTTDFFVKSAFGEHQVISIYYEVKMIGEPIFKVSDESIVFRWIQKEKVNADTFTFPIDKRVAELILLDHKL